MDLLGDILRGLLETAIDVAPIAAILFLFQLLVIRRRLPHARRTIIGFVYVAVGLSLFLMGLKQGLFPLGEIMAQQLTAPDFVLGKGANPASATWVDYIWVYVFAAAIGFATTIAEPSLMAVALKAKQVSGGVIIPWRLRIVVAAGVAIGVAIGSVRIVTGTPLYYYIMAAYVVVIVQTIFSNRSVIPLAYDSGGVTTSTVTVPLVAALGLGLASTIPGRSPLIDGFGLIAFASVFPIISVLGYAQIGSFLQRRSTAKRRTT